MARLLALSRSSTFTILKEAISLFPKNPRILSFLLLVSLFVGYLFSAFKISSSPMITKYPMLLPPLTPEAPPTPNFSPPSKGSPRSFSLELVYLVAGSAITYTLTAVNICALAAALAGKGKQQETLREVIRDAKPSLDGALQTQLLVAVLNLGYILIVAAMALTTIYCLSVFSDISVWWLPLAAALVVATAAWWVYLMVIFSLSVVVSVVEQGTCGWKANSRAAELIQGSKRQGVGIVVVLPVVKYAVAVAQTAAAGWLHLGQGGQLCVGLGFFAVTKVVSFVELGAFVVLHSGCKKRHEEEAAVATKLGYVSLPTADVVVRDYH